MRNFVQFGWNGVMRAGEPEGAGAPALEAPVPAAISESEAPAAPENEAPVPVEGEAPAPAPVEAAKPDWKEKRIAKLTAQLSEMKAKAAAAPAPADAPPAGPLDPTADFNARVEQAAAQRVAAATFNKQCEDVAAKGRGEYGKSEFDGAVGNLVSNFMDPSDRTSVAQYNNFLLAAIETGEAEKIIFQLGSNPNDLDEAERILALPPLKMAVELTKLANREAPADVSKAPKPIRPVDSHRHESIAPDDPERSSHLSTAEWMKRREAQVAENAKMGRR